MEAKARAQIELEPGGKADAEAIEESAYWFTPHGLLSLFSHRIQGHQLRDGTTHNEWDLLPSITKQENAQRLAYRLIL